MFTLTKRRSPKMSRSATQSRTPLVAAAAAILAAVGLLLVAPPAHGDSTPVGPLPQGPVSTTSTKPGSLVAVALPRAQRSSGLVWRLARRYHTGVVRQLSEADVGSSVVLVFRVVGKGDTSLVFALTRGDTSAKAVKSSTHKVHST
jgi:hypothetical protein